MKVNLEAWSLHVVVEGPLDPFQRPIGRLYCEYNAGYFEFEHKAENPIGAQGTEKSWPSTLLEFIPISSLVTLHICLPPLNKEPSPTV